MRQLSGEHIAALVVLALGATAAIWAPRRHRGRWLVPAMRGLALTIGIAYVAEYVVKARGRCASTCPFS
jgi:hypothetical protein